MSKSTNTPSTTVQVKMYRQGLGDCFLLTFKGNENISKFMLVDCGVLQGTEGSTEKLGKIALDIKNSTNHHIDIVAVTHEHWDHISGFLLAENIFKTISIDELWMAWTEEPGNEQADEFRKLKKLYINTLTLAAKEANSKNYGFAGGLNETLGLYEDMKMSMSSTVDIMDKLKSLSKKTRYCRPGNSCLTIPGLDDVRIYILGPPESKKLIKDSVPSKKHQETYLTGFDRELYINFSNELHRREHLDTGFLGERYIKFPFDKRFRIRRRQIHSIPFFEKNYFNPINEWRKIDDEWLELSSKLAIKLKEHTNNTSLVMAIEIVSSGKILLFTGDAQVGNWLGWENLSWTVNGKKLGIQDLLARTVLYKVSHHGSHNATLKEKGLELMTSDEMTAMIPVSEVMARKKNWKMPYEPLYTRLNKICKGRIIRLDEGLSRSRPTGANISEWESFCGAVKEDPLFFEYIIK